jgi:hypothetical protein
MFVERMENGLAKFNSDIYGSAGFKISVLIMVRWVTSGSMLQARERHFLIASPFFFQNLKILSPLPHQEKVRACFNKAVILENTQSFYPTYYDTETLFL